MKLTVLVVGRSAPRWADAAVADYRKRLKRFGGLDEVVLKPEPFKGDVDAVRAAEGARILAAVKPRDRLIALDERGDAPDTEGFTELLTEGLNAEGRCVFALGGPYGHDPAVRAAAWRVVRLSNLVLNHQVARLALVEQIYRAYTIKAGMPYHH